MMNKKAEFGIIGIIILLVVAWLIINNLYLPYHSEELGSSAGYYCINETLYKQSGDGFSQIFNMGDKMLASLTCMEYPNSKYTLTCDEKDRIIVTCKTTIYSKYFSTRKDMFLP